MSDRKTHLMYEFYRKCQQLGYTDMKDSAQSLKAKVIATDLGLKYGNIIYFNEEAKKCYEQVLAEQEQAKILQKEREAQAAAEAKRRAVNGELLLTLSDKDPDLKDATLIRVYMRPDKSIYSTVNGSKLEAVPSILARKADLIMASYEAPKAVYTGATVGGVTTGEVHYTKGGYKYSGSNNGKGEVRVNLNTTDFALDTIVITEYLRNRFKRDDLFQKVMATTIQQKKEDLRILCYRETERYRSLADSYVLVAKSGNATTIMNTASMMADERRLNFHICQEIAEFVRRVVSGQFPPTEQEIYMQANQCSKGTTAADLSRAINLFSSIRDYSDAKKRAEELRPRYEELLQLEKEQAVLNKDKKSRKKLITNIILNSLATVFFALVVISSWSVTEYSITSKVLMMLSVLISFPGLGLLVFKHKYGCLQRILRWVVVFVIFFISFAF